MLRLPSALLACSVALLQPAFASLLTSAMFPSLALAAETTAASTETADAAFDPVAATAAIIGKMQVGPQDWPQWGGSYHRNNTSSGTNLPTSWDLSTGENIRWAAPLGSQTYGNPVIANGKVFVGTNNGSGHLSRYPKNIDLGCLLCFDEQTGKFLWQASSPKLPTGRVHDWPLQGICSSVYCEEQRAWYVTSRGEVTCLDTAGFHDDKNNGPFYAEPNENKDEADVIWRVDMMGDLGVSQHNMCSCALTAAGDLLFVNTSNGVDESHINIPAPKAPSFICMDKNSGKVLWTNSLPGLNILHGQWGSPAYFELNGQAQVVFGGGDGWLYSFDPAGDGKGGSRLLWKFDCNPKESLYVLGGRATRNHLIGTPVFYDGQVFVAVGEDPEHGEGVGHLWCIDPTKSGDVSPELAFDSNGKELAPRRLQSVDTKKGEVAKPNPNSAVVWHYSTHDWNKNGKIEFEETMHRTIGTVTIKDNLLFLADFSGLVHCIDTKDVTDGVPKLHWAHDMFAASWGSALIVDGKVYIGDEDGDVTIFECSKELNIIAEVSVGNAVYSSPVSANNRLYLSNKSILFCVEEGAQLEGGVNLKGATDSESAD